MQATCPRCGNSHIAQTEGPAVPCPSCGYTALVVSAAPPAPHDGEPARWGSALVGCMAVSALVLICALALARLAEADELQPSLLGQAPGSENCQSTEPVCVDPSLWAEEKAR